MRLPAECRTMAENRAEIDRVDAALVDHLAERAGYIDRAAELTADLGWPARIGPRVEEVVANVRAGAEARGLPADLLEDFWRRLVDWSIAREEATLGPDPEPAPEAGRGSGAERG